MWFKKSLTAEELGWRLGELVSCFVYQRLREPEYCTFIDELRPRVSKEQLIYRYSGLTLFYAHFVLGSIARDHEEQCYIRGALTNGMLDAHYESAREPIIQYMKEFEASVPTSLSVLEIGAALGLVFSFATLDDRLVGAIRRWSDISDLVVDEQTTVLAQRTAEDLLVLGVAIGKTFDSYRIK